MGIEQRLVAQAGANHPARSRVRGLALLAASVVVSGCSVKHTVKVPVTAKIREAKTSSLDQLLEQYNRQQSLIATLSSAALKISYTTGKIDAGSLQEYRSAPGYILLKRPDSFRLNIQNPVTKGTIAELASTGDDFSIWYPRDNKFFVGRNSFKELEVEGSTGSPAFSARPIHIFEAILPAALPRDDPDLRVSFEEERDATAKYYVISLFRETGKTQLRILRKLWFERSDLVLVKQATYTEAGAVSSLVFYSNLIPLEGMLFPHSIRLDRPEDGYTLSMEIRVWRMNPELQKDAFVLARPQSSQLVQLREKVR